MKKQLKPQLRVGVAVSYAHFNTSAAGYPLGSNSNHLLALFSGISLYSI